MLSVARQVAAVSAGRNSPSIRAIFTDIRFISGGMWLIDYNISAGARRGSTPTIWRDHAPYSDPATITANRTSNARRLPLDLVAWGSGWAGTVPLRPTGPLACARTR